MFPQVGQSFAVDVTEEEEECSTGHIYVGVLPSGEVSAMEKSGAGTCYNFLRATRDNYFIMGLKIV